MTRRNNQTNSFIKWVVIAGDFLLMNLLLLLFRWQHPHMSEWDTDKVNLFWLACNMAMVLAQWKFSTIIHLRFVSGGDILRRVFELVITQTLAAYVIMKAVEVQGRGHFIAVGDDVLFEVDAGHVHLSPQHVCKIVIGGKG